MKRLAASSPRCPHVGVTEAPEYADSEGIKMGIEEVPIVCRVPSSHDNTNEFYCFTTREP
eukprot:2670665-Amphidinium_carterae.1